MSAKKNTSKKEAPSKTLAAFIPEKIAPLVIVLRGEKVLLDADLAALYGVETKRLNEAIKRNIDRFPEDFMFQLGPKDLKNLKSQFATSKTHPSVLRFQLGTSNSRGGRRTAPYAFTEQGIAMLSSVLRSPIAVEVNIAIMRTFVQLRRLMDSNDMLADKIENLEKKYNENFKVVFEAIRQLIKQDTKPKRQIGFRP